MGYVEGMVRLFDEKRLGACILQLLETQIPFGCHFQREVLTQIKHIIEAPFSSVPDVKRARVSEKKILQEIMLNMFVIW